MKASKNEIKISVIEYIMANNIEPENLVVYDIVRAFDLSRNRGVRLLGSAIYDKFICGIFDKAHYEFIDYVKNLVLDEYKKQSEI